jgi:hypothetical protein
MVLYYTLILQYLKNKAMAKNVKIGWTDSNKENFTVHFHYDGKYYPQTLEEPSEEPELVIDHVYCDDGTELIEPPEELYDYIEENHPWNIYNR